MLIGFMGAGKTTVGRALAALLRVRFVDLDAAIVRAASRSVAAIFREEGEAAFRRLEAGALRRVTAPAAPPAVVAAGGGVVVRAANRAWLSRRACVVWLDAPFATCWARAAGHGRPLLLEGRIAARDLYASRRPLYRAVAHVRVRAGSGEPAAVARRVMKQAGRLPPAPFVAGPGGACYG